MSHFVVSRRYTREAIHAAVGGDLVSYLPNSGGSVVCGCFRTERSMNPGAPALVIYGEGPHVEQSAHLVSVQASPIPVFLFREHNEWEYRGRYICVRHENDPIAVQDMMAAFPERGVIVGILFFKRVGD